jgi:hypothetical protein
MEVLWLAILIYSIGMAAVLHYRPALMFHENGTWKEFGYQRDSRHTIFPFWLFSIAWAFVSYAVAASVSWSGVFGASAAAAAASQKIYTPSSSDMTGEEVEMEAEEEEEEEEPEFVPVSRRRSSKSKTVTIESSKPRPGYYVLDTAAKKSGLRKYIYYGPNPPEDE